MIGEIIQTALDAGEELTTPYDLVNYRKLMNLKITYSENLEDILNACQMAINTLGDYSISPDELHQSIAWLRGEIKELKE